MFQLFNLIIKKFALQQSVDYLNSKEQQLKFDLAKLEAQLEERNKLFSEWSKIHEEHKEIIANLLGALKK